MINWIRGYLLSVTAVSIVCAILKVIVDKKAGQATILRLLIGIFLTITVIAPWTKVEFSDIGSYIDNFSLDASSAADIGVSYRQRELSRIIKSKTEAYILDKAVSCNAEINVDVTVSDDDPPKPCAVTVQVISAAPYARERLKLYIANDLDIPEAQQTWD